MKNKNKIKKLEAEKRKAAQTHTHTHTHNIKNARHPFFMSRFQYSSPQGRFSSISEVFHPCCAAEKYFSPTPPPFLDKSFPGTHLPG
jgi:hypothetical protein